MWCVIGQALSRERRERQREKEERQRLQEQLMERDQSIEKLQCQVTSLQQVIVARHVAQSLHATELSCCVPRGSVVARHVAQSMLTKALCYTRPLSRRQPCASAYVVAVDLSEQKRALSLIQVFCQ